MSLIKGREPLLTSIRCNKKKNSNSDYAKIEFKGIVVDNLLEEIDSYVKENPSFVTKKYSFILIFQCLLLIDKI
jgi:hypothetical protein